VISFSISATRLPASPIEPDTVIAPIGTLSRPRVHHADRNGIVADTGGCVHISVIAGIDWASHCRILAVTPVRLRN
jgi:hypothetical protein